VSVFSRFVNLVEIVLIIEPDSLPNLATNINDPHCGNTATSAAYKSGVAYAVEKFKSLSPLTMYLDGAHGGWLGWQNNLKLFTNLVMEILGPNILALRGFATNVANYQPIGIMCPFQSTDYNYCLNGQHQTDPCCADPCKLETKYNPGNNELNFVYVFYNSFRAAFPSFEPHFVIDSGRNGVGNMRSDCANWCNARGAGIGVLPTSMTAAPSLVDAYYWLKTPGESDGCTQTLPDGSSCSRYDSFCGSVDSIGSQTGEPRAPQAGMWFDYKIKQLAANAALKSYNMTPVTSTTAAPSASRVTSILTSTNAPRQSTATPSKAPVTSNPSVQQTRTTPVSISPKSVQSAVPSSTRTMKPSVLPSTAVRSPLTASLKICRYSSYCRSDSDCVAGNKCKDATNLYYSQCVEDSSQFLTTSTCVPNYGHCVGGSVCCDPGSVCSSDSYSQCKQPTPSSGLCSDPSGFPKPRQRKALESPLLSHSLSVEGNISALSIQSVRLEVEFREGKYKMFFSLFADTTCDVAVPEAIIVVESGDECNDFNLLTTVENEQFINNALASNDLNRIFGASLKDLLPDLHVSNNKCENMQN